MHIRTTLGIPVKIAPFFLGLLALVACDTSSVRHERGTREIRGLIDAGRYSDAETRARSLLTSLRAQGHSRSALTASVMDLLGDALRRGGSAGSTETLELAEQALRLKRDIYGDTHLETAESLHQLGALHLARGEYGQADSALSAALEIKTRLLGTQDTRVASTLLYRGVLEFKKGADSTARALLDSALSIQERTLGPDHSDLTWTLNALATLQLETGDAAGAAERYRRAVRIWERRGSADHPVYSTLLHNLATLEHFLGDFEISERRFERALQIRTRVLGATHPLVASTLLAMSSVMLDRGNPARARVLLEQALSIDRKRFGESNLETAWVEYALGSLLVRDGHPAEAVPRLSRSRQVRARALGDTNQETARVEVQLARAYAALGDTARARREFEHSIRSLRATIGDRREVGEAMVWQSAFLARHGADPVTAAGIALDGERINREDLRQLARGLAERQALRRVSVCARSLGTAISLAVDHGTTVPGLVADVWDSVIRSRALVLEEMIERNRLAFRGDSSTIRTAREVAGRREQLAMLVLRGPGSGSAEQYETRVATVREAVEESERELAARSNDAVPIGTDPGWDQVSKSLPAGAGLAAFVRYEDLSGREAYAVFLARAGEKEPAVIRLGSRQTIDSLTAGWVAATVAGAGTPEQSRRAEPVSRRAGEALRRCIWDRAMSRLEGSSFLFVVPDGAIHSVNLYALPMGNSGYLIDSIPIVHYLTSERVLSRRPENRSGSGLLAIGAPDYDAPPQSPAAVSYAASPTDRAGSRRSALRGDGSLVGIRFPPLPETTREVDEVAALWSRAGAEEGSDRGRRGRVTVLRGSDATERSAKRLAPGNRVVHFATHAFVLKGTSPRPLGTRGFGSVAPRGSRASLEQVRDPLLESGLVLAGANLRDRAASGAEDGILTSAEAASMNLAGVEWVVLSACETGGGDVQGGEGVLGLLRAFEIAGSRSILYSMWPVEDRAARTWMSACYEARLTDGLSTAEAVRKASASILAQRRARGLETHPANWAGFVATGDWR